LHAVAHAQGELTDNDILEALRTTKITLPDEAAARTLLRTQVEEALQQLPERERKILQLRYELNDGRIVPWRRSASSLD
jgi:RNA polymerase primary sigma factor